MSSRVTLTSAVLGLAMAVSACATSSNGRTNSYQEDLAKLTADCAERGGTLSPIGSVNTGRPQTDYSCRIVGATRLQ